MDSSQKGPYIFKRYTQIRRIIQLSWRSDNIVNLTRRVLLVASEDLTEFMAQLAAQPGDSGSITSQ